MEESSFDNNCTNISAGQLEARNLSRCISAMVCTVLTFLILLALLFSKAYKTTLQRLFLYLTIVVQIQLILICMSIELQFSFDQRETMCVALAFLTVWTAVSTYLFGVGVTLYLLYLVYKQLRADKSNLQVQRRTKWRLVLEISLTVFCIFSPLAYLWVPFYHRSYGDSLVSCWIINVRRDCTYIGFKDQIGLSFGIFYAASFIIVIAFAGVCFLFCIFAARYKLTRRHHLKTICQTLIPMTFMTVSALIEVFGLVQYIYNTLSGSEIPFQISLTYEGAIPFSQMIISFGFLAYFYSFKKFKCGSKSKKCYPCCFNGKKKRSVRFNVDIMETAGSIEQATAPASTRVEAPSFTQSLSAPYTGDFTSITDPLITNEDTGYGSVKD